mgnify:CR=1 FL=1
MLENVNDELDTISKSLTTFENARQFTITESKDILNECRKSINASHSANSDLPGNQDKMFKIAQEKAEKGASLLKKLQKRLKDDYGKSWKQDLHDYIENPEQEIVEAFSLLAILKQQKIPTREISFRMKNPDSYQMVKTTVKVSDLAYVFGLLDCVGELKRVIIDSLNRSDSDFAKKIFVIMQELFQKLEPFTRFSNSFDYLKPKIDATRYAVNDAKKSLK